ncbi:hypothetical protein [Leptolyngbya sp. FACHB-261]|uniref:hypothetical protein n=1 Tax=Leptolyngbya sp. FACHB-261 TaxID=2692806 RepID=UPI00168949A8|nr:hypothetical protein [Leptolyngbya sp. FACHB-261]MBD2099351.1 hypothetical protein [Leptolyngbya sp. FACHB-261]
MSTWLESYNRLISPEEQYLYDHLLHWVQLESPLQMLERFRALFIDGQAYGDRQALAAIDKLTASDLAAQEFKFVLNRCCHILINRWQTRPQYQDAVVNLLALFELSGSIPTASLGRYQEVRRLRQLVKLFIQTEQHATLRRLAEVIAQSAELGSLEAKPLVSLIRRYPYLYDYCLVSEDSSLEHQRVVQHIQAEVQRQFEVDLSHYVTYQVRCSLSSGRTLQPVKNPTLLSDQELCGAVKQFVGKAEGNYSYRHLAQQFQNHVSQPISYKTFKSDFYHYLSSAVDPGYAKHRFNHQLATHLKNTLPERDCNKFDDFLMVRTCSRVLNFLIVESAQQPSHYVFTDLVSNVGPTATTGLLLKIVLFCKKIKPCLEKRFSILFNHYESYTKDGMQWLIQSLENLNVALSAHFGCVDLSFISQIC